MGTKLGNSSSTRIHLYMGVNQWTNHKYTHTHIYILLLSTCFDDMSWTPLYRSARRRVVTNSFMSYLLTHFHGYLRCGLDSCGSR